MVMEAISERIGARPDKLDERKRRGAIGRTSRRQEVRRYNGATERERVRVEENEGDVRYRR